MAADRARVSYDPSRKWRGLVAQQGRVTVEADWNEAAAIGAEGGRKLTLDVVGTVGTPDGGYVVTAVPAGSPPASVPGSPPASVAGSPPGSPPASVPGDLAIGPGTLYLGGERLDLNAPVSYSVQPDWLDHSTDPLWTPPAVPASAGPSYELVYLLASEQEVSAVEDPALADVALGGPDTMARQRIRQRFVRRPSQSASCFGAWTALVNSLGGAGLRFDPASMMIESTTTLQVSFTSAGPAGPCQPAATGGYLGAENQMIRVTVTSMDASGVPTIAWGFDDASFLYRVRAASYDPGSGDTTLTLAGAPQDSYHFPAAGQAVELLRDAAQLTATDYIASPAGFVSTLTAGYAPASMSLTMAGEPPGDYLSAATPQLYLRVWQATTAAPAGQPTPLGDTGVAITLTPGAGGFHAGDFWHFALRPIQPAIVYPTRYLEAPQPPDGPRTWGCPLAVLAWTDGSATVTSCVPLFSGLTSRTAGGGGCCTVDVGPSDVGDGASLQALLNRFATQGPVTVCLEPGTYTLPAPLVLGPGSGGLTLQACRGGVVLQAPGQPGAGIIVIQGAGSVTIRGIELSIPLAGFSPPAGSFSGLPQPNQVLLNAFGTGLAVAIGISADNCAGLTIEDCTFSLPAPGQANVFGAGIFATGATDGVTITGCAFRSASPPTAVPFNSLAVTQITGSQVGVPPPYQLTFGYLQVPGAVTTATQLLHDAVIDRNLFYGVTVPALVMARLGTLRLDRNTVRGAYGGFWLVSLANPAQQNVIFGQFPVGDPTVYSEFAGAGIGALRDAIFTIATAIGQVLPATPPGGAPLAPGGIPAPAPAGVALAQQALAAVQAPASAGSLPPATSAVLENLGAAAAPVPAAVLPAGASPTLRLDLSGCQIDAVLAGSHSGAGLIVADLTADAGSALLRGNRIRSSFPMGEAALLGGVGEACVTGNVVANETAPQVPFAGTSPAALLPSYSLVLNPATTPLGAELDPSGVLFGDVANVPAVAVTGNVFIDPTSLPPRPAAIPALLGAWDVLNTVISYGLAAPPTVTGISPASGPAGTSVTVTGSGFTGATAVSFGGTAAAFSPNSTDPDTALMVTVPVGSGTVDVTVTTSAGTSPVVPQDQFNYLAVTGISPASGLAGTPVTVAGSGFTGATAVRFGATPGTNLLVAPNGTELTVTAPAGTGTVDVTVTTPAGTSPPVTADRFAYLQVTGISPNQARPGASLTVAGNGFVAGATTVTFTSTATGQSFSAAGNVTGPGTLTVTDPIGVNATGVYAVRVTTPGGTSPSSVSFQQLPSSG
jgi:hypothetical protein